MRLPVGDAKAHTADGLIVRDFNDPYIELIRLLREASEIEHGLMIQYLYGAFSVKPAYKALVGYGAPNSNDLFGVAVEEMQHLGHVNRLLVCLGASPNLARQDFPYEPDIYPFEFNLEPLSRVSLAKYAWTEAPVGVLDPSGAKSADERAFVKQIHNVLGTEVKPNYVGSLYNRVIATLEEVIASSVEGVPDLTLWLDRLEMVKKQGERGHFQFFKQAFMGSHPAFNGRPDVWSLHPHDPAYPSLQLPINPSAYVGHESQIEDPAALSIAWLTNLHYWITLFLLDLGYRKGTSDYIELARYHMAGPMWSLARHLPNLGAGIPFDPLSMGYAPGRDGIQALTIIKRILGEAEKLEEQLANLLPSDFPRSTSLDTLEVVQAQLDISRSKRASLE